MGAMIGSKSLSGFQHAHSSLSPEPSASLIAEAAADGGGYDFMRAASDLFLVFSFLDHERDAGRPKV